MKNTSKITIALLIFFTSVCINSSAQNNSDFLIRKLPSSDKNNAYTELKIKVYDAVTRERLLPIIRVDNISFSLCDTSFSNFYLSKGKHHLQVGWVGYVYSKKVHLKTRLSENYEISFYLKPDNMPLY